MISLAAPVYDPIGHVILNESPDSDVTSLGRRVNRVKTLDGGVAISDGGYSAGDRTFRVQWRMRGELTMLAVRRLVRLYPLLIVTTREGVFRASPQGISESGRMATLTLLVTEKTE